MAIKVERVHAAWTNGHITGVLLIDIKAAFPSMAKGRLLNLMKLRQLDGHIVRWMESFILERTLGMILEGNAIERHPVEARVPQSSPVSPMLFAMSTSGLSKSVKEYHQQKSFPSGRNGSVRVDALRQSRQRHHAGGLLRARRQDHASRRISPSDRRFTVSSRSVGLSF